MEIETDEVMNLNSFPQKWMFQPRRRTLKGEESQTSYSKADSTLEDVYVLYCTYMYIP